MAPMHKGVAGVANLNLQLQGALNGAGRGIRTQSGEFRRGDKVIQLRNNYDKNLFNGDIGSIAAADPEGGTIEADFDGERHAFTRGEMGDSRSRTPSASTSRRGASTPSWSFRS
jgi:exodeoxyribonuclease V alpha subunit